MHQNWGRRDRGTPPGPDCDQSWFEAGDLALRPWITQNSFKHYLPNKLMGVKPLGKRPGIQDRGCHGGSGLRNQLDRDLPSTVVIPPRSHGVVVATALQPVASPMVSVADDGRFHMAVVARKSPTTIRTNCLPRAAGSGRISPIGSGRS